MRRFVLALALAAAPLSAACAQSADSGYVSTEVMIPVRDGVRLHTFIVAPRNRTGPLPILLMRTPYGADGSAQRLPGAYRFLAADGYIFVFQDIRGRNGSEGQYLMNRPLRTDSSGIDEATDTYDTVEWLLHHVPDNNGRVGGLGISYPGWLAEMTGLSGHPAVKAVSPQAPMTDTWMGDDFFHNGAWRQSYGVEYTYGMEVGTFDVGRYDMYDWYLSLPSLSAIPQRLDTAWTAWNAFVHHPAYDAYWRARATELRIHSTPVAVLNVGGFYDQEDIYGPSASYAAFEAHDTANLNRIVLGPWRHGGWYGPGTQLEQVRFGDSTGVWFRREVEAPFFAYYLKDRGPLTLPKALMFEGGDDRWRRFDSWPPREAAPSRLYLHANGVVSFDPPGPGEAPFDQWVSDPRYPVPYRPRPIQVTYSAGSRWYEWQAEDQRFVDGRPDVMVYRSTPLDSDVVIAGDVVGHLFAATTGTDADWVVKLIDEYPDTVPGNRAMGGYELMVSGEILRGRYRTSFEHPSAIPPNRVLPYTVRMDPQVYRFQRGHRIMVQIQSTWFPLYDRNPQTFVPNIFLARASDYRSATERVYHTPAQASYVAVGVLPE